MFKSIVLLLPVLLPLLGGLAVFRLRDAKIRRIAVSAIVLCTLASAVGISFLPDLSLHIWELGGSIAIYLRLDAMGRFFLCLVSGIWTLVAFFAYEYMRHEGKEERFFGFYTMTLGILMGLGLAGNLLTLYMFYEMMTLITVPLVIHNGSREAVAAGFKYLGYSTFGAGLALIGFFFLNKYCTATTFAAGGTLDLRLAAGNENLLFAVWLMMMIGFGCKAGMLPLQAWLPTAHPVAPAPASAVLSGIITKAGVLAIIRVTFYLFGADFLRGSWAQTTLLCLALATVFAGSMLAYKEKILKKRLAYSTVSQVSYVLFGLFLLNGVGFTGALLQVVFHAVVKNLLFLAAGAIIYKTGKTDVRELVGIGKEMPVVIWCFAFGALSLIGIPPTAGFVSKWYLAQGGISEYGALGIVGAAVLLVSALLTAGYLLPIVTRGFFPGRDFDYAPLEKKEPSCYMTVPLAILAVLAVLLGVFPGGLTQFIGGISAALF
ncbi:MAG: proton-conducting transporter membrane subunit [Oscillospiraceae bacterium]|nr:proton-conducting transporter membrane subunit [Oscillospiraceae bacterium]